jgi:hypothetical protein
MGPPSRSLAAEANGCFMVGIRRGSNRIQGRGAIRAQMAGSPRFVLGLRLRGSIHVRSEEAGREKGEISLTSNAPYKVLPIVYAGES